MASHPRWQQVGGNAAEVYERQHVPAMFAPWAPTLLDLAGVQPGERVLDVACGTGVVARLAAARVGSGGRVVGLDVNAAMLAVARSLPAVEGSPTEWLESSALEIPLPDATFDVVLCQQGLQQFPDRPAALREMRRVLAGGGRLAASVWSRIEGSPGMAALVEALERHVGIEAANNRRAPFALGDADELRGLLAGAGFRDVRVRTLAETARFPSPEALVEAQLAATPLSTLGTLTDEARWAVARDVRAALRPYLHDGELAVPMEAHVALAAR
jgi:ubiquinone/menaquinone biosynthesis C-methylase UbiE